MRLIHSGYGIDIEVCENEVYILCVEQKKSFAALTQEILDQKNGKEGNVILSEKDKILNITKEVEIIINPFVLDCNEKRIQQKLYQEVYEQAVGNYLPETTELNAEIISFLEKITLSVPYDIIFDLEEKIQGMLKIYGVRIEQQTSSLLEKIIDYLKILVRMCRIKIFIFVNLKTFLDPGDLKKLYEFAFYEKMNIILIENQVTEKINCEKVCILDQDMCIIKYE